MRRYSLIFLVLATLALPASLAYASLPGGDTGGQPCSYTYGAMPQSGGRALASCTSSFATGWRATLGHAPNCGDPTQQFGTKIWHGSTLRWQAAYCDDGVWHWSNVWPNNESRLSEMFLHASAAFDIMMVG